MSEQERFLLGECVQAYLPVDGEQKRQFEALLQSESYAGVRAMNQTMYEKGQMDLVYSLIEARFGPVSDTIREDLERMPTEQLRRLALKVGTAASLADLGLGSAEE
ncbi:MAG: hypothetical protein HUU20_02575 [Pirellulales bacterium]|nr:hypothetical protein [Pirellulales bacterium]